MILGISGIIPDPSIYMLYHLAYFSHLQNGHIIPTLQGSYKIGLINLWPRYLNVFMCHLLTSQFGLSSAWATMLSFCLLPFLLLQCVSLKHSDSAPAGRKHPQHYHNISFCTIHFNTYFLHF